MLGYNLRVGDDFSWDVALNYSKNINEIVELSDKLPEKQIVLSGLEQSKIYQFIIKEGGSYGDIYGYKFQRDANGNIMKNDEGKALRSETTQLLGNVNPDFLLSLSNSFKYKNLSFKFLIDGKFGGKAVSMVESMLDGNGLSQRSADARNSASFVVGGTEFDPKSFYSSVGGASNPIAEQYTYDADVIRLREMSLGYTFNKVSKYLKDITVSAVARNLFIISKDAPFDPDLTVSSGNSLQGLDVFGLPSTRTVGFNIKLTF